MKKFIYIFCIALLAAACVEPLQPYLGPVVNEPEEGAPVTLEFSLPLETKGTMAHNPTINTIHVAVFNQAGVLKQFEQATLTTPGALADGNQGTNNPKYSVKVNMSSKPRILHFIADSPITTFEALVSAAGTSGEDVILNALTTAVGATAYWQRIELERIDAYTYKGGKFGDYGATGATQYTYTENNQTITVYVGDYIKRDGKKVLDGTGYFQSDYVAGMIANIPLVRNFAEITVTKATSGSNFTPVKFALVNVPKAGYVAPFDTKKGEFASAYINAGTTGLTHSIVSGSAYPGSLFGSIDKGKPTSYINAGSPAYMYERTTPTTSQPATCILVAGEFNKTGALKDGDGNTWFKIEIADANGDYFPIYRGLSYDIEIGQIDGTNGYASADDAFAADPIGDVSGSVTTATLEQISDGKGTTLWVEYIDYVATSQETKTLYYTMYYQNPSTNAITDLTSTIHITSESVSHPDENYKAIVSTPIVDEGTYNSGTPDDTKTWKKVSVPLAQSGQNTLHSILRIQGTAHTNKPMYRDVHYRVMGTQHFQNGQNVLKGTPLDNEEAGKETTLTIYLPSDLGFSMFPITLRIEAENGNFTTSDGLPVEFGPSLFDSDKNAFYFLKTIEYEDYNAMVSAGQTPTFTAKFKTTRDGTTTVAGTNATHFRVLDKVKTGRTSTYFDTAECYVSVGGPVFRLSSNAISVKADVISATFTITSTGEENKDWSVEVTSGNVTSITPNEGQGNATITVNFGENTSTTEAKTYIVTAKRTGFDDQVLTITQQPTVTFEPVTRTVNTNNSTFNTSYVYTGDYASELSMSLTGGYSRNSYYIMLYNTNYNGVCGVTVSANTITSIVITWYSSSYAANQANTTISNGGGSFVYSTSGTYPTTTWTGSSDSVTLRFTNDVYAIRSIAVTYLHEAE